MKSKILKLSLAVAFAAMLIAAPKVSAGTLVQYALAPAVGVLPTNTVANITATSVTNASMATFTTTANPWALGTGQNSGTLTNSVAKNFYFAFTIAPNSGYNLTVTNLTFWIKTGGGSARGYSVRSSLDAYATDLGSNNATTTLTQYTVTPGSSFANLLTPVIFRFYFYCDTTSGTAFQAFSNLTVNGSVAVSALPPGVPTGLTAVIGNNQVALSWTGSSNTVAYNVKRSPTSGSGYTTLAAGTAIAGTSLIDTTAVNNTPYYYVVSALNAASAESANSSPQVAATPIAPSAAPSGLTATPGADQVVLNWTAASGATGYNVKRSTTSGSGYQTLAAGTNVSGSPFTDSTVFGGVTYYYVVSSVNPVESTNSPQVSALALGASAVPTGLTATPDVNQVQLTWSAAPGAASYNVYRGTSTGGETYLANASGTTFTDTTAVGGSTYFYYITGTNAYAESAASLEASAPSYTVPLPKLVFHLDDSGTTSYSDTNGGASNVVLNLYSPYSVATSTPTDLHGSSGTGVGGGKALILTTNAAATGIPGNYNISSNAANPTCANMAFGNMPKWTALIWFKPLTNWTSTEYLATWGKDSASDIGTSGVIGITQTGSNVITVTLQGAGAGGAKIVATIPGGIPTNVWNLVTASYDGTNFNLYYGTDTSAAVLVTNVTSYVNNIVNFNTNGWVILGAKGTDGTSPFKGNLDEFRFYAGASGLSFAENLRQSALAPAAPSNLSATPGAGEVSLSWTASAISTAVKVTYNVKRSTTGGAETTLPLGTNFTGTSYTDLTALGGTTYYYEVSAVTYQGESANSLQVSATPTVVLPDAPGSFTVVPSNGVVFLSWSLSAGAATYNIKRSSVSGSETTIHSVSNPTSSYADTSVVNGTGYYYEVTAVSGAGESLPSTEYPATPNVPSAVPVVTATANTTNSITLAWSDVVNTSLTTPLTYNVWRSTTAGAEVLFTNITPPAGFIDLTAYNGTTYYYKVSSLNGNGESAKSTEVSATPTGVPQPPTNLGQVPGATNVTLSWTPSIGIATGYNVYRGTGSGGETYLASVSGTTYFDTSVTVGTQYFYYVTGTNIYGEGLASAETNATPYGIPALAVRMPFDDTNTGTSYYTTSDSTSVPGTANITLTMTNYTVANVDLHGAAGSGIGGVGAALDYSSRTNQGAGTLPRYATYDINDPYLYLGAMPSWTVTMWFKPTQPFVNGANADLFVIGGVGATYAGAPDSIGLRSIATNQLVVRVNNHTDLPVNLSSSIAPNVWHFVALSYDGFTLRTYLGTDTAPATQVGTTNIAGLVNIGGVTGYAGDLMFGNNINSWDEVFAGMIDEFRFYTGPSDANYVEVIRQTSMPSAAPAGLAAVPEDGQVVLSWSPVANAVSYNVKRSTSSGAEVTIANVTSPSLTDTGLTDGTIYYYTVTALNGFYESASSTEVLGSPADASTPPAVTVVPASTNAQCGSTVTLVAAATGTSPVYQWRDYLNNPISNATNQTLTLVNVHSSQNGNYSVVVTNLSGKATNSSALTVVDTVPPVITMNGSSSMTILQRSVFTDPGATANDACDGALSVSTSGSVNTSTVGTYTLTYTATDGSNSATNTRTVTVVANYLVQLDLGSDSAGSPPPPAGFTKIISKNLSLVNFISFPNVASSAYTLTFTNIKAFNNGNVNSTLDQDGFTSPGGTVGGFSLSGLGTNMQVTIYASYGWNGAGSAAKFVYGGATTLLLTNGVGINPPSTNTFQSIGGAVADGTGTVSGTFSGKTTGEGQIGAMIFVVETAAKPSVTLSNATVLAECSSTTNLTAVATGAGPLTYQWYDYNHSPISNATNSTLVLANLHAAQAGNYSVAVANPAGTTSVTNTVIVVDTTKPVITSNPNMFIVVPATVTGTNVYFTVVAADSCDGSATVGSTPASGSFFAVGTNTVNTYAYDSSGNTNTSSFQVVVHKAVAPAMSMPASGVVNITFFGIPNSTNIVQTTTNLLTPWWTIRTNIAGSDGFWLFTDPNATNGQQYYRSGQP